MGKQRLADWRGLVTNGSTASRPQNSLLRSINACVEAPGVIRSRRGFAKLGATGSGGPIESMATFRNGAADLFLNTSGGNLVSLDGSSVSTLGALPNNDNAWKMKHAQGCTNLYVTGDAGVRRVHADKSFHFAGMPRGLMDRGRVFSGTYTQLAAPSGAGILAAGSSRAYRATWHRNDAAGVEMGGPPTERLVVRNVSGTSGYTGTARDATWLIRLPYQYGTTTLIDTNYTLRVWASRTSTGEPDDELFLLWEQAVTAGDVAAGYISRNDSLSDSLLVTGARLHTNQNDYLPPSPILAKGILNADEPPPMARDVAYWRDVMWYAMTTAWPWRALTLLALPADGDTITINGVVLTFKTVTAATSHVEIPGYASVSNNLEACAKNLCDVINVNRATTGVQAAYISGTGALPGQVLLYACTYAGGVPTISASVAASWRIGSSSAALVLNTNQLAFSKPGRADAVPAPNVLTVGPSDAVIQRILPWRDWLLVFTDYGVYRVSGYACTDFAVDLVDATARLLARESVCVVDDQVFAWCTQGIARVSATGVEWVSFPVEPTVQQAVYTAGTYDATLGLTPTTGWFARTAFAVGWQDEHKAIFFFSRFAFNATPRAGGNYWHPSNPYAYGRCDAALVFDTRTQQWGQWVLGDATTWPGDADVDDMTRGFSCGIVRASDNSMVMGETVYPSNDCYLYSPRTLADATPWADTPRAGGTVAFQRSVRLSPSIPEGMSVPHWQELAVHWERSPVWSVIVAPTQATAVFSSDVGSGYTQSVPVVISAAEFTRYSTTFIPQQVRRSPGMQLELLSIGSTCAFGVEAVEWTLAEVSNRMKQT